MKKLSLVLALSTSILLSLSAQAEYTFATCSSTQGTPHKIVLVLANQSLMQVRIRIGTRSRALIANKLIDQNTDGVTIYNVRGVEGVMEVDNQILSGNGGLVKFSNDEFSCL